MRKKIEITKDNYEGYLKLYLLEMTPFKISEKYKEVDERKCCEVFNFINLDNLILFLKDSSQLLDFIEHPEKQNEFFKNFIIKNDSNFKNRVISQRKDLINIYLNLKMLKMRYPYLELNYYKNEIEEALIHVGLLRIKKNRNKIFYKIDYENFENYLKTAEIVKSISLFDEFDYQAIPRYNYSKIKIKV